MTKTTVVGGTGYVGSAIVREATSRGIPVISYSRSPAADQLPGVTYRQASVLETAVQKEIMSSGDVIVCALSPRDDMTGKVADIYKKLAELATPEDVRLIIIGGFGSMRPAPGQPRLAESEKIAAEFAAEAKEIASVVEHLQREASEDLDWLFVSPAEEFGAHIPGEARGKYRVGDDVAFYDEQGNSAVSGADFAKAIVDEIEQPSHRHAHISIAY